MDDHSKPERDARLQFLRIDEQDCNLLAEMHQCVEVAPQLIDALYEHLFKFQYPKASLQKPGVFRRHKLAQHLNMTVLFSGRYDGRYFAQRSRLGLIHKKSGIQPRWYIGAMCHYLVDLVDVVSPDGKASHRSRQLKALLKIVFLELSLALDAQFESEQISTIQLQRYIDAIAENLKVGVLVVDKHLVIQSSNDFFSNVNQLVSIDLAGCHLSSLITDPVVLEKIAGSFKQTGELPSIIDTRDTSQKFRLHLNLMPIKISRPQNPRPELLITVEDLTKKEPAMAQARRLATVVEQTDDLVMITNVNGTIEYANPSFYRTTGFSEADILGNKPNIIKSGLQDRPFYQELWQKIKSGQPFRGVFVNRKKNGSLYYEEKTISPLVDDQGKITQYCSTGKDITAQLISESRLQKLARQNPLTGLASLGAFKRWIRRTLAHTNQPLFLLLINIDRFRHINDIMGYERGDEVLQGVANQLKNFTPTDAIAHSFADNFFVTHHSAALEEVFNKAKMIQETLSTPYCAGGICSQLTVSIGISTYPNDAEDADKLIQLAQLAVQSQKNRGGNGIHFYAPTDKKKILAVSQLRHQLSQATLKKQFTLQYQPQVRLQDGAICGVEALLRWRHPELGDLSPAKFIPELEDSGLIIEVGEWVLCEACRQFQQWQHRSYFCHVAVNVSSLQLLNADLVAMVNKALDSSGMNPGSLVLELTESAVIDDTRKAFQVLNTLSLMNVQLAIDDFGTGYSSLIYLRDFPFDFLKLDRSFITDLEYRNDNRTIAQAVLSLASGLNMQVVAEGVENQAQLNFLTENCCQIIQGFIFSRPLPGGEIDFLLRSGKHL